MNEIVKRCIAETLTFIITALTFIVALIWNDYIKTKLHKNEGKYTVLITIGITFFIIGCIVAIQQFFYYTTNDTIEKASGEHSMEYAEDMA